MLERHFSSQGSFELAAIRLEDRRPLVLEEVPVLGIHDDWNLMLSCECDRSANDRWYENALVVVLDDQRVRGRNGVLQDGEDRGHLAGRKIAVLLLVEADQLLRPGEDACFGRRGSGAGYDSARRDTD